MKMRWIVALCSFASISILQVASHEKSNLFRLMYFYGERYKRQHGVQQYLVVTLLTETEYNDSETWATLDTLIQQERIRLYFNTKYPDELKETGSDIKHGEIMFLHMEPSALDDLDSKLPKHPPDELPVLIMYSFYIPCACVKNCNFNCAEELGNAAEFYKSKYRLVVAYNQIFKGKYIPGTDEQTAYDFMNKGGIQLYKYVRDTLKYELVQHAPMSSESASDSVFQNLLLRLLVDNPVSVCTADDKADKERITAAFLNFATRDCFERQCRYRGGLTKLSRTCLKFCLNSYVQKSLETDCDLLRNGKRYILRFLNYAIWDALRLSDRVGYPTEDGNSYFAPVPDDVTWNGLFNARSGLHSPRTPKCLRRPKLSVESLCTKRIKNPENLINTGSFTWRKRPGNTVARRPK